MSITMDHTAAEQKQAVERYLLGEASPEERAAFEEHFFDCPTCAADVRTGAIFVDNTRVVLREARTASSFFAPRKSTPARADWRVWFRPSVLIPSFATATLSVILGYQSLVILPRLLQPQVLSTAVIAPLARDAGPSVSVDRHRPLFNINFEVESPRAYRGYRCTFERQGGGPAIPDIESGARDVSSFTLSVLLPQSKFPDGVYTMMLRPAGEPSALVQRYTFTVHSGGLN